MKEDPGIAWIREVRHRISQEFGHDPRRLVDYYKDLQKQHKDRLLWPDEEPEEHMPDTIRSSGESREDKS